MADKATLAISEIFGPTYQGEGPWQGLPVIFLRLAGCNLACAWCDTPYTWNWKVYDQRSEVDVRTVADVRDQIAYDRNVKTSRLVVSGGEPLLQQEALQVLHNDPVFWGWQWQVETAGTIMPQDPYLFDRWVISPKLANSGNSTRKRYHPDVLQAFMTVEYKGRRAFKFVAQSEGDFEEIDRLVKEHKLDPVWIMPEGRTVPALHQHLKAIVEPALARGYRLSYRLHTAIWGTKRGY